MKALIWVLFLCVVLVLVGGLSRMNSSSSQQESLKYIFVPAKQKTTAKSPVLILLHGVGSNEKDLLSLADTLDSRLAIYSLRAPITMGPNSFAWFHVNFTVQGPVHNTQEAEAARRALTQFIQDLKSDPDVDGSQIFLLGFSQGAIMNLSLAFTEPDLVRGIVAISGRTLQEVAKEAGKEIGQRSHGSTTAKVLLLHGIEDGKLPLFHGEASAEVLKTSKFEYEFKKYHAGHEITSEMREDIQKWLTSQIVQPQ